MAGSATSGRLTIGAVLRRLEPDFPDISISKIRFLEAEGLISPARTPSGYRTFAEDDVRRLTYILTAQRDRFWPLKVIREALDAMDRGLEAPDVSAGRPDRPQIPLSPEDPDVPTAADLLGGASDSDAGGTPGTPAGDHGDLRVTAEELARATGMPAGTVEALVTYGLLRRGSDGNFPSSALPIARACADLSTYGLEPRHLRPFRTAAEREVGLVEQVLSPTRGRPDAQGEQMRAQMLSRCIALHTALVKAALGQA